MSARLSLLMGALAASGLAGASPLAVQPSVAVAADYESDPDLRAYGPRPETIGALLLSAPVTYDEESFHASLQPNARLSTKKGYSSLGSNYLHTNAWGQFAGERGSLSLTAGVNRDTSLAHGGESDNGVGVRTDTVTAGAQWQYALTERTQYDLGVNWQKATYDQGADQVGLVNYHYLSAAPDLSYAVTERTKFTVNGAAGRYTADNGITSSKSYSLQIGIERQLSEAWTLSAGAGYSKSENAEKVYYGPFYLGTTHARQQGGVYTASLVRHGEVFSVTASASRAFLPSGFGLLSRQDSAGLQAYYNYSERWAFVAQTGYHTTGYALAGSGYSPLRYLSGDLSANWNWTPEWVVSLHLSWIEDHYQSAATSPQSRGVSLQFTRQFYRIEL